MLFFGQIRPGAPTTSHTKSLRATSIAYNPCQQPTSYINNLRSMLKAYTPHQQPASHAMPTDPKPTTFDLTDTKSTSSDLTTASPPTSEPTFYAKDSIQADHHCAANQYNKPMHVMLSYGRAHHPYMTKHNHATHGSPHHVIPKHTMERHHTSHQAMSRPPQGLPQHNLSLYAKATQATAILRKLN